MEDSKALKSALASTSPTSSSYDVVVVGAGHSGGQVAAALRQRRYEGSIALIGEEADPPYERPALSKEYLAGAKSFERMVLRPQKFWNDRAIDLRLGERAISIDPAGQTIALASGRTVGFEKLVWAAGGSARLMTCIGFDLFGVHSVRTRAGVNRMQQELTVNRRIVIIGGGYIGLEAAATLVQLGHEITIVEAMDRVLSRVSGSEISDFYESEHRARGVKITTNSVVECLQGQNGKVCGVMLANGHSLEADLVIVGIGISPEIGPLLEAGAEAGNGVAVDELCKTSLPNVYAIGDCALHQNRFANGMKIRLESLQNANDMAIAVAKTIAGEPTAYDAVPWFWSNQYDLRMQTAGIAIGHDETLLRGDQEGRSFCVIYLRRGRVIAIDAVNAMADFVHGKTLVAEGARLRRDLASDASIPLKDAWART